MSAFCPDPWKLLRNGEQGKNLEHLIGMKGNDYDAAKMYFQKWGDRITQRVTRDGEKQPLLQTLCRSTYVRKITSKIKRECYQKITART